ncbi:hypothetical protein D1007_60494 [Hordeum vulgare]|nr:hypothetical protein D1007_60494 [Hordeum vulgare]
MSEIERDKLSLQEVKGFVKDDMQLKESKKFYFEIPGKSLADALMFVNNDRKCVLMGGYTDVGGVAHIYVEYHGEEDSEHISSGSYLENDEFMELTNYDEEEPATIISVEPTESLDDETEFVQDVMVPDDSGVITQVIGSPIKANSWKKKASLRRPSASRQSASSISGV